MWRAWARNFSAPRVRSWPEDKSFLKIPGIIYRLGRKPDPWAMPDWASAGPDGTFGNRFDDPDATYRVLYASSQRLGCFLETRARFRVDPKLLTELAEIAGEDDHLCQPVRPATQRKCSVYVLTVLTVGVLRRRRQPA